MRFQPSHLGCFPRLYAALRRVYFPAHMKFHVSARAPLLLLLAGFILLSARARAGLRFEENIIELHSSPREMSVPGVFRFQNDGKELVTIRKVRTSCGCTTAKLDKMTYQPGEHGEIHTVFKYGFARGPLRKLLTVELADDTEIPLEIHVRVEAPVTASPTLVYWREGEAPETRTVAIRIQPGVKVELGQVECDSEFFKAAVGKREGQFVLEVTPGHTDRKAKARIRLPTKADGVPGQLTVYARVQ